MPKLKTHKGAKRRFRVTGSGKFMRMKGNQSHKRLAKRPATRRLYDEMLPVSPGGTRTLKKLLPYG